MASFFMRKTMTYKLLSPPAEEPITLAEAKLHLRETGTDQDALITRLIRVARGHVESATNRALMLQTWDLYLDEFECDGFEQELTIYQPPFQSVTHIKYTDDQGVLQTMDAADYQVDNKTEPARIVPAYGEVWPSTQKILNAVNVRFIAGYDTAADVPDEIKQAMLLLVGHLFENREAIIVGTIVAEPPMAVRSLLGPYVMKGFY